MSARDRSSSAQGAPPRFSRASRSSVGGASSAAQRYAAMRSDKASSSATLNVGPLKMLQRSDRGSCDEARVGNARSPRASAREVQANIDAIIERQGGRHHSRSGFLWKQGVGNKAWKERWFVLPGHGPLLLWYDTGTAVLPRKAVQCVAVSDTVQAEAGNFGGSTAGWSFDVWGTTAEGTESLESSTGAKMNRFLRRMSTSAIDKEGGRTRYVLAAPSMREAQEWLDALREVLPPPTPRGGSSAGSAGDGSAEDGGEDGEEGGEGEEGGPARASALATANSAREGAAPARSSAGQAVEDSRTRLASITKWVQAEHHGTDCADNAAAIAAAENMHDLERRCTQAPSRERGDGDGDGGGGGGGEGGVEGGDGGDGDGDGEEGGEGGGAGEDDDDDEGPPPPTVATTDAQRKVAKRALFLCRQAELSEELEAELEAIATGEEGGYPQALLEADERGIMPVHWLCGSPAVTVGLVLAVFETTPRAASCRDSRGILPLHWLCANANATAEMLLLALEAHEPAIEAVDNFGQTPLHWLCGSASEDARSYQLVLDASPDALGRADRHGLMPIHWLCSNAYVGEEVLRLLLDARPDGARTPDAHGQLPIHILCSNEAVTASLLQTLLGAFPEAASLPDADGCLPLHFLAKCQPDAVELWRMLLRATEEAGAHDLEELRALMPVLLGEGDRAGEVTGVKGRVKDVVAGARAAYVRPEDRGALLFVSSISAVKHTREGCKQVAHLLDTLMVRCALASLRPRPSRWLLCPSPPCGWSCPLLLLLSLAAGTRRATSSSTSRTPTSCAASPAAAAARRRCRSCRSSTSTARASAGRPRSRTSTSAARSSASSRPSRPTSAASTPKSARAPTAAASASSSAPSARARARGAPPSSARSSSAPTATRTG